MRGKWEKMRGKCEENARKMRGKCNERWGKWVKKERKVGKLGDKWERTGRKREDNGENARKMREKCDGKNWGNE